jgi:hypothetical protein
LNAHALPDAHSWTIVACIPTPDTLGVFCQTQSDDAGSPGIWDAVNYGEGLLYVSDWYLATTHAHTFSSTIPFCVTKKQMHVS